MQTPITEPLDAKPLDANKFARLVPRVRSELLKRVGAGVLGMGESLQQVFVAIFGADRSREEQIRFLFFAAPIARRIAIERALASDRIGTTDISIGDLKTWLRWLDAMDPLCSQMIDLHYFAGLSFKETADVLQLPPHAVIRELRFAKAWLQLRLT